MAAKTYGVGIVGIGSVARTHALAINELPNSKLVGGTCRTEQKGRDFAQEFGGEYIADYKDLLSRDDVDVVSICTPSGSHAEQAIAAAEAGKHIICEKPLDISLDRVDGMIAAAEAAGIRLGGIFPMRFQPAVMQIKKAIEAERFGRLSFVGGFVPWWREQSYYDEGGWKGTQALDGGGALMNQGIHVVDLLIHLGGALTQVRAATAKLAHPQIKAEDTAVACLEFKNGALGTIVAATSMYPGRFRRLEISGTSGSAVMVEDDLEIWTFVDESVEDAQIRRKFRGVSKNAAGASDPAAIGHLGHLRNYEAFFEALDENREPDLNGYESRKAVELVLAIYRAAELDRAVGLPLTLD